MRETIERALFLSLPLSRSPIHSHTYSPNVKKKQTEFVNWKTREEEEEVHTLLQQKSLHTCTCVQLPALSLRSLVVLLTNPTSTQKKHRRNTTVKERTKPSEKKQRTNEWHKSTHTHTLATEWESRRCRWYCVAYKQFSKKKLQHSRNFSTESNTYNFVVWFVEKQRRGIRDVVRVRNKKQNQKRKKHREKATISRKTEKNIENNSEKTRRYK